MVFVYSSTVLILGRQPQQSGEHILMYIYLFIKIHLFLFRECKLFRQNLVPSINAVSVTGNPTYSGSDLVCNTNQIDVIADTQVLGKITLIKGEVTPNLPYSEPVKNTYIGDGTGTNGRLLPGDPGYNDRFYTLESAQRSCSKDTRCAGVTKETDATGDFSNRGGFLNPSPTKEISWAKVGKTNSPDPLPWKIITNGGDLIISK